MLDRTLDFFRKDLFRNYLVIASVWCAVMLICGVLKYMGGSYNNFLIFTGIFDHTIAQLPLYVEYPAEYGDIAHYGVLFSMLIAPFALMPTFAGLCTWLIASAGVLFIAIRVLPIERWKHAAILWFIVNELYTVGCLQQYNIMVVGFIVLSFGMIERRHDFWAAFFIVLGILTKLYGVVGLAFFFFSRDKIRFILSLGFWGIILYLLPALISSYSFVQGSYIEWITDIAGKNSQNMLSSYQNISLLGMARKITQNTNYSDLWIIIPGLILFALPYLRIKQYKHRDFRLMLLASTLLFVVLFSTGSESSTYIIALTGVGIWICSTHSKTRWLNIGLLVFAFVLTSLSPTDVIPRSLRLNYILPYALKALPCVLIWLKIVWEQLTCDFTDHDTPAPPRTIPSPTDAIDVILPCYNPPADWVEATTKGYKDLTIHFPGRKIGLIVVNDGSQHNFTPEHTDHIKALIPNCRIISYDTNRGKGFAVRTGVAASEAPLTVYTDADFPYTPASVERVVEALTQGYDVVVSSRNKSYYNALSPSRKMLSWGSKYLNRVVMNLKFPDTQGGLKGFNAHGREIMLETTIDRFLFDTEFVAMASRRQDITITAITADLRDDIELPNMGFRIFRREFANFIRIILFR